MGVALFEHHRSICRFISLNTIEYQPKTKPSRGCGNVRLVPLCIVIKWNSLGSEHLGIFFVGNPEP
ncbi:hypothetical protein QJS04_geneDACA015350 [Acorus gramineus]|uniref:Uncharacterized protein n=1 Tax=Acorus gramineus TaxID=55184 RepID=A0AAV9AP20_ACOGR|nr:hypothetical protein QJS04_geneDACA015350 [Acorus gramineus]